MLPTDRERERERERERVTKSMKQSGTIRQEKALPKAVLGSCAVSIFIRISSDPEKKLQPS